MCFDGIIPHNDLLRLYKAVDALVFPSTIETFGLPLIEAASMGKPIIASDLDYAREVLGQYKGVSFVPSDNAVAWSDEIMKLDINSRICYLPIELPAKSSWEDFFNLINYN